MTEHDRKPVRVGFIGLGDDSDVRDVLETTGFSQLVVVERIDVDAGAPEGLCRGRIRGGKIIDDGHNAHGTATSARHDHVVIDFHIRCDGEYFVLPRQVCRRIRVMGDAPKPVERRLIRFSVDTAWSSPR